MSTAVAPLSRVRRWPILLGVFLIAYVIDQGTKIWAVAHLEGEPSRNLIGSLLKLTFTRNPGAAFSAFTGHTEVFTALATIATLVILYLTPRVRSSGWAIALGLLLAGILGNLTDRVFRQPGHFRGHVVDFLQLPHWPIFNLADVSIDIGVALIILQVLRGIRMDGSQEQPEQAEKAPAR